MNWIDPIFLGNLILSFDDQRFVDLCNSLLSETCAHNGIDRSCLATNLNIKEPDGGIDARCVSAPKTIGRLIPCANVDYQFKGGRNRKSIIEIVDQDIISKPRVTKGLGMGHAFVYMVAWDRSDQVELNLIKDLRSKGISVDDDQIVFIGNDSLARLLQVFPSLVARLFRLDMSLFSLEEWSGFKSLSNPFQTDSSIGSCLSDLRAMIEGDGAPVRVVGSAGDGKTRMVSRGTSYIAPCIYCALCETSFRFGAFLHRPFRAYKRCSMHCGC